MATVLENIQARLHAINSTITGVRSVEYFDTNIEEKAPIIVPLLGQMTRSVNQVGAESNEEVRTWTLLLICGAWNQGLPSKSVQQAANQLVPLIHAAYLSRPRLELNGSPLDYVKSVKVASDTGIITFGDSAAVQIPLLITYRNSYTYNGG